MPIDMESTLRTTQTAMQEAAATFEKEAKLFKESLQQDTPVVVAGLEAAGITHPVTKYSTGSNTTVLDMTYGAREIVSILFDAVDVNRPGELARISYLMHRDHSKSDSRIDAGQLVQKILLPFQEKLASRAEAAAKKVNLSPSDNAIVDAHVVMPRWLNTLQDRLVPLYLASAAYENANEISERSKTYVNFVEAEQASALQIERQAAEARERLATRTQERAAAFGVRTATA